MDDSTSNVNSNTDGSRDSRECRIKLETPNRRFPTDTELTRNVSYVNIFCKTLEPPFVEGKPKCKPKRNVHCTDDTSSFYEEEHIEAVPIVYQRSNTQICETYRVPIDLGHSSSEKRDDGNSEKGEHSEDGKKTYLCFYFEQGCSGNRSKCDSGKQNSNCNSRASSAPKQESCTCKSSNKTQQQDPCSSSKFDMTKAADVTQSVKCGAEKASTLQKCRQLTAAEWKVLQYRKLARDNYCPGTIQDAADGNINFNALVLNLMKETFGSIAKDPGPYTPMSLLEVFYRRIKAERSEVKHFWVDQNSTSGNEIEAYFRQKVPNDTNRAIMQFLKCESIFFKLQPEGPPDYDFSVTTMDITLPNGLTATTYMGSIFPL